MTTRRLSTLVLLAATFAAVLLSVAQPRAAYTTATLVEKNVLDDGKVALVVRFNGNAGEPAVFRTYYVDDDTPPATVRRWAIAEAARLTARKTSADGFTVGTTINLSPIATPAPSAEETWRTNYARFLRLKQGVDAGVVPAAELDALRSSLLAGWSSAYAAGF